MGEIVGYVTRSFGGPSAGIDGMSSAALAPNQKNSFVGSKVNSLGATLAVATETTAREAMRAVENAIGAGLLKWTRTDSILNESYEGALPTFWPGDLGLLLLPSGGWWRADSVKRLKPVAAPPSTDEAIMRWGSKGNGGTIYATASSVTTAPIYADAETLLTTTGRPAARFTAGDVMLTTLTLSPPFSIYAAVSYTAAAPARAERIVSAANFQLSVSAAGAWQVISDGDTHTGPVAADGETALLSAIQTATDVTAYLNGDAFGTSATALGASTFSISQTPNESWEGDIFEILIVPSAVNLRVNDQIVKYFLDRYNINA